MTVSDGKKDKSQPVETKAINIQEKEIYNVTELTEKPEFPGGMEKFYTFIGENYKTPTQPNLKGKVYATFIIEKDGRLTDIKTLKYIGHGTAEETIRVLKLSPKWTPGKVNEKPVRTQYSPGQTH